MLPLVVPTPEPDCPAQLALRAEGYDPDVRQLDTATGYGELLHELWEQSGFILVEWDIAPWPGAVAGLATCESAVCVHRYPNDGFESGYGYSLGCIKFSDGFVRDHPLEPGLRLVPWQAVDSIFWRTTGRDVRVCVHSPGVAHVRRVEP